MSVFERLRVRSSKGGVRSEKEKETKESEVPWISVGGLGCNVSSVAWIIGYVGGN